MYKALGYKLGCLHKPRPAGHLMLSSYYRLRAPVAPERADYTQGILPVRMFGNDQVGDCPIATLGHHIQAITAAVNGTPAEITDDQIIAAYTAVTGIEGCPYNPQTGECDNGALPEDALKYWKETGIAGHHCDGSVALNLKDVNELRYAANTFCGFQASLALPLSAADQFDRHAPWHYDFSQIGRNAPGSWGYHRVWIGGYDAAYLYAATWDRIQAIEWAWFKFYAMAADAVASRDFINALGVDPLGVSWDALWADLRQLGPVA